MTTAQGTKAREFREDINGLRAWAVMAVVLYHFGVAGIGGGFAGVDVFFVISGYLMCGIIVRGQETGSFGLWRFYLARARRIWPALIVLCIAALLCGWFFLMPEEYRQLGRHARESLTFSSNLRYFDESGYFDVASQEKWLLHTWSLAVEWQFYLLLPLLIMLQWKLAPGRRPLSVLLALVFAASLAWCIWRTAVAPSEAFYMLQSRAWEMLAGALVFLLGTPAWSTRVRQLLELVGFVLIIVSVLLLDSSQQWPGWRAIFPVAGAVLVLLAARQQSLWTATLPAQWLGTRSYSIYLWHWPLVVALAYLEQLSNPLWVACAIVASLVLGHFSYAWVELPSQRWLAQGSQRRGAIVLILMLVLVAVFAQQVRREGFPQRLPDELALIEAERENHNARIKECLDPAAECVYGAEPVRAILLGDSHADAVVTAIQAALPNALGGVKFRGGSGCLIAFGFQSTEKEACQRLNQTLEQEYSNYPADTPVIYVGRTSEYVQGALLPDARPSFHFGVPSERFSAAFLAEFGEHYVDTLCRLAEGRTFYVTRPIPEMSVDVPTRMGRSRLLGKPQDYSLSLDQYHQRHAFIWKLQDQAAERCGVRILDPLPYLCADGECVSADNGRPLYRDHDHLSEFGNRRLVPMFQQVFAPQP